MIPWRRPWALAALLAGLLATRTAPAQECCDYRPLLHWAASWHEPGLPAGGGLRGLALHGAEACVVADGGRLVVLDLTDPRAPARRAGLDLPGAADGASLGPVAAAARWAAVGLGDTLAIVDLADPAAPFTAGRLALPQRIRALAPLAADRFLALAGGGPGDETARLVVVDVDAGGAPAAAGEAAVAGTAEGLAVADTLAAVACPEGPGRGLQLFSLRGPAAPRPLGALALPELAPRRVALRDGWAFLADAARGLAVADLSDPGAPRLAWSEPAPAEATDVLVQGGRLALATVADLRFYDVSDPARPLLTGTRRHTGTDHTRPTALGALPGHLLVAEWTDAGDRPAGGLQVFADGERGPTPARAELDWGVALGDLALGPGRAYVAEAGGLAIVGLARPGAPQVGSRQVTPEPLMRLALGDGLLVGCAEAPTGLRLRAFTLDDPGAPEARGALDVAAGDPAAPSLVLAGDLACLAWSDTVVAVVDCADPDAPALRARLRLPAPVLSLAAGRGCVYAGLPGPSRGAGGLAVLEVHAAGGPRVGAILPAAGQVRALALAGDLLLGALADPFATPGAPRGGLATWSTVAPLAPAARGYADAPLRPLALAAAGGAAWLAGGDEGLALFGLGDPARPECLAHLETWRRVDRVAAREQVTAVTGWLRDGTPARFAVAWPPCGGLSPVRLGRFDAVARAGGVDLAWQVAAGECATEAFALAARRGTQAWEVAVRPDGACAWAGRDDDPRLRAGGTVRYALRARMPGGGWEELAERAVTVPAVPAATRLLPVRPNPANPRAEVPFALERAGPVELAVFDAGGRRVATLARGPLPAGEHAATWDGTDARGRPAAAGVYLVRLRTEAGRHTRRLTLAR